jgi:protein phosphatase 1 regulatory subunit 14B
LQKPPIKMECGVTGGYTNGTTPAGILADVRSERSPSKTGLHVNFKEKGEIKERREKFLTAKYGHHQMSLIRKRLAVEMWLYEELKKLYETSVSDGSLLKFDVV